MYKYIPILSLFFLSCSNLQKCPELEYNSSNKLTTLPNGEAYTGRCLFYQNNSKRAIQQYVNGIDYCNWVFYFPNGEIETDLIKMEIELVNGDIIMSQET